MRKILTSAALLLPLIAAGTARADCPGGDNPPSCITGAIHRLGANLRCFKVTITPSVGPVIPGAVVYNLLPDGAAEGLEKLLQEGASVSVLTEGGLSSSACGDGSFFSITGTRATGY